MSANAQVLRIPIGHSKWLQRFSLVSALFALLSWQFVSVSLWLSVLGTVVIVTVAIWRLLRPQPLSLLSYHSTLGWRLSQGKGVSEGKVRSVELRSPRLVTENIVALSFNALPKRRLSWFSPAINLCLCADAVPTELHRKLRVVLNTQQGSRVID